MRYIEITRPGPPEALKIAEAPDPVPGPAEILIRVAAAGVNRPDVLQRKGGYPPPPGASPILGLEVAGTVARIGEGVHGWQEGDRVCALVSGGGYATHCVAPAAQCLPVPEPLDLTSAAAIPETFFTVWSNVFERGRLAAGESALFHGGSSGIGTTAIQLAAARGATVYVTAGTEEKCRACEALGATKAINYRTSDFVDAIRAATRDRGVDLILDIMGGSYLARNLASLATDGRLVQIGLLSGDASPAFDLWRVMSRRLTITGSLLRPRPVDEKGAIARALHEQVWPLLATGAVRPIVHQTFALADAASAHALMESGEHIGKIVLVV